MASTVTPHTDMAPSPRVVIDIDDTDLHVDAVTGIVMQLSKWGEVPVNRTPRAVAGGLVITDYEVPPGVPVTYRVQQFDVAGESLGFALTLQTQVDIPEGVAVISDPLAPADAVMVGTELTFAGVLSRSRPSQVYQAGGQTFAMSGLYSAFQNVPLRCWTDTAADRDTLARVLEQSMILVRTMPSTRLPGAFYAHLADVPMIPWDAVDGGDTDVWDLTADEVTRPGIDVIVPVVTLDMLKAFLDEKYQPEATLDDLASEWATLLDILRNPPVVV